MKILIADTLSKVGLDYLAGQSDVQVDYKPGLTPGELAQIIGGYDGMILRSGIRVTADVLANPGKLRCIARAGVGVDNIDVPVATAKGVIVMNTPGGNTLSTCELTWALMLAMSRKIVQANVSLRGGAWERKKFEGTQLAGKTLGVIGLGRIGKSVAKRALAMEMKVLAYDPYFAGSCPQGSFTRLEDMLDLCRQSDYITVHTPKSNETSGMIGQEEIAAMKDGVRLINAARGGIIDPEALLSGLESGKVAGAAIDVWAKEPPESEIDKKLIAHPNVLALPHLGASTEEAQEQVALEAAQQLVEALHGGDIRNAVNAPGFDKALPPILCPYVELSRRMGTILSTITAGAITHVEVGYYGAIAEQNVSPITAHLLVGLMTPHMEEPVNVINAPVLARQRGIEVEQSTSPAMQEFANVLRVTVRSAQMQHSAVGTIFGHRYPRVIGIDGHSVEMRPEGHIAIILNRDVPGALATYSQVFGRHGINIASLTLSRDDATGLALVGINLDQKPSDKVMAEVRQLEAVEDAYYLSLPPLPAE